MLPTNSRPLGLRNQVGHTPIPTHWYMCGVAELGLEPFPQSTRVGKGWVFEVKIRTSPSTLSDRGGLDLCKVFAMVNISTTVMMVVGLGIIDLLRCRAGEMP